MTPIPQVANPTWQLPAIKGLFDMRELRGGLQRCRVPQRNGWIFGGNMPSLRRTLLLVIAVIALHFNGDALAQKPVKQIELTSSQILAYLEAQPEVFAVQKKIIMGERSGKDPAVVADIEYVVKKHGLRDTSEYNDVLNNLILVFNRIDPKTRVFKTARNAQQIRYQRNVELIIQHYDRIKAAFEGP
jgi:hypothetical protein